MDSIAIPNVSLRQLQYIVAVADLGGFRRAAEACRVAQPSLSVQVAHAEEALGLQIFERNRRVVAVSRAGAVVVDAARGVLLAARDMGERARQAADLLHGTLRLGVIPTIGPYLLPEITPPLARAFPRLTLQWTEARTDDLVPRVRAGALDGALLALEAEIGDLEREVLGRDRFVLAAAAGHPLVKPAARAQADVLSGASVLLLDDGHCFRSQALNVCAQSGAREHSFRATSLATLVQMVSTGTGVTLLPAIAVPVENRRGQLRVRRFASPEPGRTLALVWRRGSALRTPLRALAATMRAALRDMSTKRGRPPFRGRA
jgi:LysR family transcriptional regulator, hydrogen peroxide-inducible genes activator